MEVPEYKDETGSCGLSDSIICMNMFYTNPDAKDTVEWKLCQRLGYNLWITKCEGSRSDLRDFVQDQEPCVN